MALKSVEVTSTSRTPDLNDLEIKIIHATCDTCSDDVVHRFAGGDGIGTFQVIKNAADSGLESGYRVKCPNGHGAGFSVSEISCKLP